MSPKRGAGNLRPRFFGDDGNHIHVPEPSASQENLEQFVIKSTKLFNKKKFFRFHEVLEQVWLETKGPEREFLQGLIQVGAAFVHFYRGRRHEGTLNLIQRGSNYLRKYPAIHMQINVKKLLTDLESVAEIIRKNNGFPARFRFPKIEVLEETHA